MANDVKSFFVTDGDTFFGQPPTRGPWSRDHCHAGPVTGLIARAVENLVGAEKTLTRLTVDLSQPSPMNGFRIDANLVRTGRTVATALAVVRDLDDRICATAASLHVAARDIGPVPTVPASALDRQQATAGIFPIQKTNHSEPCFPDYVEIAYPPGEGPDPGSTTLWMKTLPLLPDEEASPFQRLCPLADCGNGTSRNAELSDYAFMNADITIVAHRMPTSDWLASSAHSHWHSSGLGMAQAVIHDEQGPVATVLQTVILNPVRG